MYGLADCNNFFVSCQRVFDPSLEGRAVVVLSNNDGCAISRSNEAKALGIRMGQPYYQFADLVRAGRVEVFSSNFMLYGDMSRRIHQTLRELVPAIEAYSIDEAFLDLRGIDSGGLAALGRRISATCLRNVGIPVSVGIAPTKTLAKIASRLCKRYPRLEGSCYMHRPEDVAKVLARFPIGDVWGIGRRYARRLEERGVHTAADFCACSVGWVRAHMGMGGERTWRELHGEPCIEFEHAAAARKQICVSRTFASEITDFESLRRQTILYATMCAEKLRRQGSVCGEVQLFVATNRHRSDRPQYGNSVLMALPEPTDSTILLAHVVTDALREIFRPGFAYKRAGVVLSAIVSRGGMQVSLFDDADRERHSRLMHALDSVNGKLGPNSVMLASQELQGLRMHREHLSPSYTTDWNDILQVKV